MNAMCETSLHVIVQVLVELFCIAMTMVLTAILQYLLYSLEAL